MIRKVAPKLKEGELKEVFAAFDSDSNGTISYDEFEAKIKLNCNN